MGDDFSIGYYIHFHVSGIQVPLACVIGEYCSKLNVYFYTCLSFIGSSSESMETSSSPEQTSIIAVATTSTVVTSSKLKPPQDKILKVTPPVKPKSTKKSSTRSKLRHSTGHESRKAYQSLFTSSAPSRPKEQSAHWVTYFPYY